MFVKLKCLNDQSLIYANQQTCVGFVQKCRVLFRLRCMFCTKFLPLQQADVLDRESYSIATYVTAPHRFQLPGKCSFYFSSLFAFFNCLKLSASTRKMKCQVSKTGRQRLVRTVWLLHMPPGGSSTQSGIQWLS